MDKEKYTIIVVLGLFSYTSTKIWDETTRNLLLLMYPITLQYWKNLNNVLEGMIIYNVAEGGFSLI